jgi:cell wall-associated NlpC family hydrolase
MALFLLSACAAAPPRPVPSAGAPPAPSSRAPRRADEGALGTMVAQLAMDMIGVPYRYGGADPRRGFDCSGLVYYTYTAKGLAVPRTSQAQFNAARKIPLDRASQGDLVFFQDQEKLSHVGIYLGDGLFVHAPSSGGTVTVATLDTPYYQRHLVAVGRLLPN